MFWVSVTLGKFAYCRVMAKVKSQRRGDETGTENRLTKRVKRLAIKKDENKETKNLFKWGEKSSEL